MHIFKILRFLYNFTIKNSMEHFLSVATYEGQLSVTIITINNIIIAISSYNKIQIYWIHT